MTFKTNINIFFNNKALHAMKKKQMSTLSFIK